MLLSARELELTLMGAPEGFYRLCHAAESSEVVAAAIAQLQVRKERGVAAEGAHDVIAQRGARQRVRQRARAAGQAHGDVGLVEGAA